VIDNAPNVADLTPEDWAHLETLLEEQILVMPAPKPNDYPPSIVPRAASWLPKEDCE
jgi:hypothetical protein